MGYPEVVAALLAAGANPASRSDFDCTAMTLGLRNDNLCGRLLVPVTGFLDHPDHSTALTRVMLTLDSRPPWVGLW